MMLAMAAHWIAARRSCRKHQPDSAPSAGSPLIRTPNVGSASAYRKHLERVRQCARQQRDARAAGRIAGSRSAGRLITPMGAMTTAPITVPIAVLTPPCTAPAFWPKTI